MESTDDPESTAEVQVADVREAESAPTPAAPLLSATGLGVDGEHGPLFRDVDLELGPGLHAVQMPAGPDQAALLLTLAGRLKPSRGTVVVMGDTAPRRIRKHCAIAAFEGIDELDEPVTVQTVLAEQARWLAPWYSMLPNTSGRAEIDRVFGDRPAPDPHTRIAELSDLDLFLLRITLALLSDRPILVVGDLEQVRYTPDRDIAIRRLHAISELYTVIVGVTNPLDEDAAPGHHLHDHRTRIGKD